MLLRAVGGIVGLVVGLVVAGVVLLLGPQTYVTCDSSHGPAAVAEEAFQGLGNGHIDGDARSACPVPSAASWVGAVTVLVLGTAGGVALGRPAIDPG